MADIAQSLEHLTMGDRQGVNEHNITQYIGQLETVEQRGKAKKILASTGLYGLRQQLEIHLAAYCNTDIKLAIAGQSGVGKSSLLNTLRDLGPTDKGAAKVGEVETTNVVMEYTHPKFDKYKLYDVPGLNGMKIRRNQYVQAIKLRNYNVVIICFATRFAEDDLWLAQECENLRIPYVFVRTKIDQDVRNGEDARKTKSQVIQEIKEDILKWVIEYRLKRDIFLISTKFNHSQEYDFPKLVKHIAEILPEEIRIPFIFSFEAFAYDIVYLKRQQLEKRISDVALCGDTTIIGKELNLYKTQFALTDEHFSQLFYEFTAMDKEKFKKYSVPFAIDRHVVSMVKSFF